MEEHIIPASGLASSRRLCRVRLQPIGRSFDAAEGVTLLQAAHEAGVPLRNSCRNGTCRTCRARVQSGSARHLIDWPGLSREEKLDGWILPCVAAATSDLVLEVPERSAWWQAAGE